MKPGNKTTISDEMLNAYIDDELNAEERELVFRHLSQDEELGKQACETQQLQYLLRQAYQNPPKPVRRTASRRELRRPLSGLAAGLLLSLGSAVGWYSHTAFSTDVIRTAEGSEDELIQRVTQLAAPQSKTADAILHVNSADPEKLLAALDRAENLLQKYRKEAQPFHLEIIANNSGVELLRNDKSAHAQRVRALLREYDNLSLSACSNTLQQLQLRGVKIELLPGVKTNHTAIEAIIERLDQGWRYMKV